MFVATFISFMICRILLVIHGQRAVVHRPGTLQPLPRLIHFRLGALQPAHAVAQISNRRTPHAFDRVEDRLQQALNAGRGRQHWRQHYRQIRTHRHETPGSASLISAKNKTHTINAIDKTVTAPTSATNVRRVRCHIFRSSHNGVVALMIDLREDR